LCQQGGVPCHFSHEVGSALNVRIPNCCIGRGLPMLWRPQTPY
jgi:hypothetical protein